MKNRFSLFLILLLIGATLLSSCAQTVTTVIGSEKTSSEAPSKTDSSTPSSDTTAQPSEGSTSSPDTRTPVPTESASSESSPDVPAPVAVKSVSLDRSSYSLTVGNSFTLNATVLPVNASNKAVTWKTSNSKVATVTDGKVVAVGAGSAAISVVTEDGNKKASCIVKVENDVDPIVSVDLSGAQKILDLGCFGSGLRVKSTGEILFSPNMHDFLSLVSTEADYELYKTYLRFTYISENDAGNNVTYPSLLLSPQKSKGSWVDYFLQGDGIDCGFCPTADATYRIEVIVVKTSAPTKGILYGTYQITAAADLENSKYYDPTPIDPNREPGQFYIYYAASAHGSIEGEVRQLLEAGAGSTSVTAVPEEGYIFSRWSDGVTSATRSGDTVTRDTKITAYFTVDNAASKIPALYITTESGKPVLSKEYANATLTITGAENSAFNIENVATQIRGRGNSSWNGGAPQTAYDSKNSYRLHFEKKIQLLGIGNSKNKDWVLQSNKFDISHLRNYLVWTFAASMGTLPYVPECAWVQLYVNNEYRGMYMICELVEVANDRIEIDENSTSEDKAFLIEFDFRGNYDDEPYFYLDNYGPRPNENLHGAVEVCIKSKVNNDAEIEFIKKYMEACNAAIQSGNRAKIDTYIDIPSLIDMYIIEELTKDCDVGRASFYVQRNVGGKLYFTAPWDFDFGFGTYGTALSSYGIVSEGSSGCPWYAVLIEQSWFRKEVRERMNELQSAFEKTLEAVKKKGAELSVDADISAYFWNLYGESYHPYVSRQVSADLYSYDEHLEFLVNWATDRWMFMTEYFAE
ncbi:MAG TPA: hypothetical protein DEV98_04400 [Clostridiales bacterium]|nr:hypothetical protein [Clostridiales bacterium]